MGFSVDLPKAEADGEDGEAGPMVVDEAEAKIIMAKEKEQAENNSFFKNCGFGQKKHF